ncbi:peptidoglycan editing factor PgeF [Castellaniella sp.]|uniref:peptidoglycan editing factor PgeF n=1 Tax=Castellaniella sp. TaxID=1955812 RepID=UPI002AFF1229|nr:peptidoglycan editing factor PgeF [Castellaniella sp.]
MRIIEWAAGLQGVTGAPWQGVQYVSTWRAGGVSAAPWDSLNLGLHVGDDPAAVQENRARVQAGLPAAPLWLDQVHGTTVWHADEAVAAEPAGLTALGVAPCADAAITASRGLPLAIMTADCLPVVLADDAGTVLGVAHAGWRGLAAGVLENTLAAMQRRAASARGWRAWIGPGIGPDVFEVGDEVRAAFAAEDAGAAGCFAPSVRAGHWLADLAGLAERRLAQAGVARVELSGECTYRQAERYFSYRRQARTGRQATLAWLA